MRFKGCFPVFLCFFLFLACQSAKTPLIDGVSVLGFGAKADGKTDNTTAFQKALDHVGKTGGTVYVPIGKYRFDGSIVVPEGVTLKGSWEGPHLPSIDKGSTLLVYGGRDKEGDPAFITLKSSAAVKGLSFYYPEQKIEEVHPYPWTIRKDGFRCSVIDCAIANTYNGIDFGTIGNAGYHIRNLDMCALRRGVYVDRSGEIGRFENIHIHPLSWYLTDKIDGSKLGDYLMNNLEGFIIGICDWDYMINCFVIQAKVGFRFIETPYRSDEKPEDASDWYGNFPINTPNILITQSGSDLGPLAVKVERVKNHAGISFENCQFMSGVEIDSTNTGPVKFSNCGFWGKSGTGAVVENNGVGTVFLTACHFSAWEDKRFEPGFKWDPKVAFIDFTNGSLHIVSCAFKDLQVTPDAHIRLTGKTRSAVIMGNSVEYGKLKIDNKSKADVQIIGNVKESL